MKEAGQSPRYTRGKPRINPGGSGGMGRSSGAEVSSTERLERDVPVRGA